MKSNEAQARGSAKEWGRLLLKAAIGGGLIYYVLSSKMINFDSVRDTLTQPLNLTIALLLLAVSAVCCAVRWYRLMRVQGLSMSFWEVVELTMIGYFFNSFMPGSVGGDLIKAWYAAGQSPNKRTRAVFTVLLDRLIGLWVIVSTAAITLAANPQILRDKPQLQLLAISLWAFTLGSLFFVGLFLVSSRFKWAWATRLTQQLHRIPKMGKIIDSILCYRNDVGSLVIGVLLSATSIIVTVVLFKVQGNALGIPMDWTGYFFIVPIAQTVSAIPILPGGIGVGQLAFFTLFDWAGLQNPTQGGSLSTLLQIYTLLFNCLGAVFYLKFKKRPAEISNPATSSKPNRDFRHQGLNAETSV